MWLVSLQRDRPCRRYGDPEASITSDNLNVPLKRLSVRSLRHVYCIRMESLRVTLVSSASTFTLRDEAFQLRLSACMDRPERTDRPPRTHKDILFKITQTST